MLSGAVKRQHDPRDAAGGEFVWRMSLRLASAMTPRLPAALPAAGETCISREWTVLSCCARWLTSWTATCCPCRNDLECLFDENGSPQLVEAIPSWRVFVLGGTADTVGEGRFRAGNTIGVLNLVDNDKGERNYRRDEPKLEIKEDAECCPEREHSAICYEPEESRLIIFGG